jgi:hypothetical protein
MHRLRALTIVTATILSAGGDDLLYCFATN